MSLPQTKTNNTYVFIYMTSQRRGDPRPKWIVIGPFMLACCGHMQVLVIQLDADLHLKNQVHRLSLQCCSIFLVMTVS